MDDNFEMASKQLRELFRSPQVGIILSPAKTNLFKVTSDPSERSPTRRSQDGSGNKPTHNPKVYDRGPSLFNEKAEHK